MDGVIRKTSYNVKTSFIGFTCGGGAKRLVTHFCVKEEIMSSAENVTLSETLWWETLMLIPDLPTTFGYPEAQHNPRAR